MVSLNPKFREPKPVYEVAVCPDLEVAEEAYLIADGYLCLPAEAMQSTDGRYAWSAWQWPDGLMEKIKATCYLYDNGNWKKEAGWTDKPPPPPEALAA